MLKIEAWINANTGEVIIREPYEVIDWTLPGELVKSSKSVKFGFKKVKK